MTEPMEKENCFFICTPPVRDCSWHGIHTDVIFTLRRFYI
jgi:hypothetical protein